MIIFFFFTYLKELFIIKNINYLIALQFASYVSAFNFVSSYFMYSFKYLYNQTDQLHIYIFPILLLYLESLIYTKIK